MFQRSESSWLSRQDRFPEIIKCKTIQFNLLRRILFLVWCRSRPFTCQMARNLISTASLFHCREKRNTPPLRLFPLERKKKYITRERNRNTSYVGCTIKLSLHFWKKKKDGKKFAWNNITISKSTWKWCMKLNTAYFLSLWKSLCLVSY